MPGCCCWPLPRRWRCGAGAAWLAGGPPWPWLAWWAVLPLFWGVDKIAGIAIVQPWLGAPLLVLLAGRPLAVLALLPVAGATLHRLYLPKDRPS